MLMRLFKTNCGRCIIDGTGRSAGLHNLIDMAQAVSADRSVHAGCMYALYYLLYFQFVYDVKLRGVSRHSKQGV
jgi:hypothetical protein